MTIKTERDVRRALGWLARRLRGEYRRLARRLVEVPASLGPVQSTVRALERLAAILVTLGGRPELELEAAQALVRRCSVEVAAELQAEPWEHYAQRGTLLRVLDLLQAADARIALAPPRPGGPAGRVVVPSDLLYQAHHALFPAERMLVANGRRRGRTINLGALFDVTGASSQGHVRADPQRLGRALIAMDLSDSYLAAWIHSHPGRGREATRPSSLDQEQYQDWIRDYTPHLVGAIFAADGWVRFWGTAVEAGRVEVQVAGDGVYVEDQDGTLCRLSG